MPEPLTPDRLRQLQALFAEAVELDQSRRAAFLVEWTRTDPSLATELSALLDAHDSTGEHLAKRVAGSMVREAIANNEAWRGARVGAYEVGDRIGIGGMGEVYHAVRADDQFKKQVALKFLRRGVESELAIRRFRYERQILANLNHRNIAALLDGGVTDDGQPYFVMELVEGQPITTWCDARQLGIAERVQLFRQVCGAVQHAHQNLVVHRDLKPGNILVTHDGTVKLLDFGIAKLLREDEGSDQLPPTQGGARAFTPDYASPEQVRGLPVGTTSDVYALGVILFELLTGSRPFELTGHLFAEIESIVSTRPPPRPSTVLTAERPALTGERSLAALRARVSGDLDAIILTALRKEPDRRYGSAEQLARDLALHLDGMPVTARPEGLGYRFAKFVRRRPMEATASVLVTLSLVGGVITTTRQAQRAEAERERATEITEFLTTMLAAPNPDGLGRDVTMREVLDSAAVRADSLGDRPVLAAEVREVIGDTYAALGELELARDQFTRAAEFRRIADPEGSRATAVALTKLGITYGNLANYEASDSVLAEAEEMLRRTTGPNDVAHGTVLQARGSLRQEFGDLPGAEAALRDALAFRLRVAPDDHVNLTPSYNDLGVVVGQQGRLAEAESLHVLAVRSARLAYGDEHPILAAALAQHAFALEMVGKPDASDSLYQVAIAMRRRVLGEEHPDYAWTLFQYAQFLGRREDWEASAEYARQVLALRGRSLPESHPAVATALQALGLALGRLGRLEEGERYLRESLELRRVTLPPGNWLVASGQSVLGDHLALAGKYREAERLLLDAEQQLVATRGPGSPQVADARQRLVRLYTAMGRSADSAAWHGRLEAEGS